MPNDGVADGPDARRVVPWALAGAGTVLAVAIAGLHVVNGATPSYGINDYGLGQAVQCVADAVLGALIIRRHPRHVIGWLLCGLGLSTGLAGLGHEVAVLRAEGLVPGPVAAWGLWLGDFLWLPAYELTPTVLVLLFPTGRPPSRRWWPVAWAAIGVVAVDMAWMAMTPFPPDLPPEYAGLRHPLGLTGAPQRLEDVVGWLPLLVLGLVLASTAGMLVRLARARGVERDQLRWFVLGAAAWIVVVLVDQTIGGVPAPLDGLAAAIIPLGAAVGILRHDLYDIRRVIDRTLVFVLLSAGAATVYGVTVLLAHGLIGGANDTAVAALAVGAVVAAAVPLYGRVQRLVDRLVYGDRRDPYAVLARLNAQLEAAIDPANVLPALVQTLAQSLRLPYVAVEVRRPGRPEVVLEHGVRPGETTELALVHQGLPIGRLVLGGPSEVEKVTAAEHRLLGDLARQLAGAAHAVELAEDLLRSREQLVLAREEERRRIRRDLHDGLGPQLAGIALQLGIARKLVDRDPVASSQLLDRLGQELHAAVDDVRRLVYDLRPPALDDLGLVAAIRQRVAAFEAGENGLQVSIEAPDDLGELPAAVEVAAYRIITEAVTNVARHAGARRCDVRLTLNGALEIEVGDDGHGVDGPWTPGVGLSSLRERAEELGGQWALVTDRGHGTRVTASLPVITS